MPRETYRVDDYQVTFDREDGWRCECPEFIETLSCEHIRPAAVMRAHRTGSVKLPTEPKTDS
jgi:hypothetical protein